MASFTRHDGPTVEPSQPEFVVALSGGVDSAVVAKAAHLSGRRCLALTAVSPSVAELELKDAKEVVGHIGIPYEIVRTEEIQDPRYQRNDARRCYFCKSHLYGHAGRLYPSSTLVSGTNADDLGDYRPGLQAAAEHKVFSPLAQLGFGKGEVRALANLWKLPVSDKPASPCLASRLAYGVEVTPQRLAMVEQAEICVRRFGLREFRVRLHSEEVARIEVHDADIPRLLDGQVRAQLDTELRHLGFAFVTLDLGGFKSGSLNQLIQIEPS